MDSRREESNLLFLPNLCLCCNIHIFVKVLCRSLCADWVLRLASLRPAIMSDCVQTKPAQPLNFTAFGSHSHTLPHFPARCFARRETSKKKHTDTNSPHRPRDFAFSPRWIVGAGVTQNGAVLQKKKTFSTSQPLLLPDDLNKWDPYFIDDVFCSTSPHLKSGMSSVCLRNR